MPYRIDLPAPPDDALDTLVHLGALDVEDLPGGLAAILPDAVPPTSVASALRVQDMRVSPAVSRDDGSVWTLSPRPVRTRSLLIVPAGMPAVANALRLSDGPAFGTGRHPTTALCLEAIEDLLDVEIAERMLDVGTGSGVLALAALRRGVQRTVGLDIDGTALRVAAENARINGFARQFFLVQGGTDAIRGSYPLVTANIRAAELMAMASTLVRRVASGGRLVLSGVPESLGDEVARAYERLGLKRITVETRDGWSALVFSPSW